MGDPSKTIVLAGSGRSGTTWLGNIIAANWSFRIIFEPFDARQVPEAKAAGIPLRPYCSPGEGHPDFYSFTRLALAGKLRNRWVDQEGRRFWAWRFVLKTIRATLLLAWIDENFHSPIVYLIRHPGSVIASRCRLGWESHLDVFLSEPALMRDYLSPYTDVIKSVKTEVQKHTVMWCVENVIPLKQLPHYDWIFCTYEHFYTEPLKETHRLLSRLGLKETRARLHTVRELSHVTHKESALKMGKNILTEWKKELSTKDIADMTTILREFGINLYSVNEPLPNQDIYASLQNRGKRSCNPKSV
jgi:hypothetical protein